MKKLLFGFILMLFSATLSAQYYNHFPDFNAIWRVYREPYPPVLGQSYFYQYTIKHDTLIAGNRYKIIYCTGKKEDGSGYFEGYTGFLRDDTVAKKVYLRFYNSNSDSLLYDFSLNIGDTLRHMLNVPNHYGHLLYVDSIDSILLGNKYYKRFILGAIDPFGNPSVLEPPYIIEGIGSTFGFIEPMDELYMDATRYTLQCFSLNDTTVFPLFSPDPCELIMGIEKPENSGPVITIAPNPFSNEATINYSLTKSEQVTISIYDINRRLITVLENDYKTPGTYNLIYQNTKNLHGVYFLQLKTNKNILNCKMIVIDN